MPPEGRKLLVLATTSQGPVMQEMELASAFNVVLHVPMLREAQIAAVLSDLGAFARQDVRCIALTPCPAVYYCTACDRPVTYAALSMLGGSGMHA